MFSCITHGWSNPSYVCPECFPLHTRTSSNSAAYPDYLVGISGQELEKLRHDLKITRQLLKEICDEWNEDCDESCDSYSHAETCKATNIANAKKALQEEIQKLKTENDQLRKALQKIAEKTNIHDGFSSINYHEIARIALEKQHEK